MSTGLTDLADFIIKSMVDDPHLVQIVATERGNDLVLELQLPPDEVGKIIGKQGKTIRAIRTVIAAAANHQGRRISLEIIE